MTVDELLAQYTLPDDERKRLMMGNALLGLGMGLASSKRGGELSGLTQGLFAGTQAGAQQYGDAQRGQMDRLKLREHLQGVIDKQEAAKQAAADQQQVGAIFSGGPQLQNMGAGGPTPQNAAAVAPPSQIERYRQAAAVEASKRNYDNAKKLNEMADKMEEEWSQTPQVGMSNGQAVNALISKRGNVKMLDNFTPTPKFREMSDNKTKSLVNEYNIPAAGMSMTMQTTPDADQSDARARAQMAQTERHWQAGQGGGSKPQLVNGQWVFPPDAQNPTGRAVTPEGMAAGGGKELTESQGTAALYLGMMKSASADIGKIKQPPVGEIALARGDASYVPKMLQNWVASPDAQKYAQSSLQWTEAMLRITTGATAPPEEVARTSKTFFPQIGDTKAVIEQKNAKRKQMEEFVRIKAGAGAGKVDSAMANEWSITEVK